MENFMNDTYGTRRLFCMSIAAAGISATLSTRGLAATTTPNLNLDDPDDALTAMVKMRGSLIAEDVPHWYSGTIYSVLPGTTPVPMVDFEGSEIDYYARQPDGSYRAYGATVSFFRDTVSGKLLDEFKNPITGKLNKVQPNTISIKAHYIYAANGFKRSDDPRPLPAQGRINDHLKWEQSGPHIWLTMRRAYPAGLPMGEHQLIRGSLAELHDPSVPKVYTTAAPTFIAPWLRWMDMGDHPGHTVWAGPARKLDRVEDYPRRLLDLMEKHFPEKLTAKPG
jgi:hypothetical protein